MPNFTSLSVAISARVMQMQTRMNSQTATDMGMITQNPTLENQEQNVLVWGKSFWGVDKVSVIYKP